MANLSESATWESGIYRLETSDPVLGGESGISNLQGKQLANRTQYLKAQLEGLESVVDDTIDAVNDEATARASADTAILTAMGEIRFTREVTYAEDGGVNNLTAASIKGTIFNMLPNVLGPTTLNLPAANTVPNGSIVGFRSFGSDNTNLAIVNRTSTNTIKFEQVGLTQLVLEPGDMFILVCNSTDGVWNVIYHRRSEVGKVEAFARTVAPIGWLECNGQAVSRTTYANLYLKLGTRFGIGDNSTTFNVPDLRAEFIRGWDHGKGTDLNSVAISGTRTNGSAVITGLTSTEFLFAGMTVTGTGIPGGTTILSVDSSVQVTLSANATASGTSVLTFAGRELGSKQEDMFESHFHIMKKYNRAVGAGAGFFAMDDQGTDGSENTEATGGVETRPRNMALMYCIKF